MGQFVALLIGQVELGDIGPGDLEQFFHGRLQQSGEVMEHIERL